MFSRLLRSAHRFAHNLPDQIFFVCLLAILSLAFIFSNPGNYFTNFVALLTADKESQLTQVITYK
jgi:hypothetical protein